MYNEEIMKQNQHELANKLVVVAGGAGEIGERITRMFLQQGERVLVPSRSKEKLKALGTSLEDISTGELIPLETDVSTPQGLNTLTAAIKKEGVLRAAVSAVGSFLAGSKLLGSPGRRSSSRHSGIFFTLCWFDPSAYSSIRA